MTTHQLRVGILSNGDPGDVRTWSGTPHYMVRELERRFAHVRYVRSRPAKSLMADILWKLNTTSRKYFDRGYVPEAIKTLAKAHSKAIISDLERDPVDVLFAIAVDQQTAYLTTSIPIVQTSDATLAAVKDYYPYYSNLWAWSARKANEISAMALSRATTSVYPSSWAAESAHNDYGVADSQIHIVPYGANMDDVPSRDLALSRKRTSVCKLLFVGVEWDRKGGQIAYDTMLELRKRSIDCRLVIVGCDVPKGLDQSFIEHYRFLDKSDPKSAKLFHQLWNDASFLCMPCRSECYGIVFAEAAAYGLPVVSSQTGGISEVVADGTTGALLPLTAVGSDFADSIQPVWEDHALYETYVRASRDRYESTLNWSTWGDKVSTIILEAAHS